MGETIVYWGYNLAWKIIRWIPETKAYSLADRFADFIYARNGKGVIRLRSNYQRVRPELDKAQLENKMYTDYEDQFQWFLGLSLVLFFIEFLISERVSEWFKKINLFGNAVK
jgi:lauroyl/myristoyl acyltransferase